MQLLTARSPAPVTLLHPVRLSEVSAGRLLTAFLIFLTLPALCYYFITARIPSFVNKAQLM
jgi:hypothetical protein